MSVRKCGPEIGPDTKRRAFKLAGYIVLLRPKGPWQLTEPGDVLNIGRDMTWLEKWLVQTARLTAGE